MHCLMYPKFLDFKVRIASALWFTHVAWIPSTFSFVQVTIFRVCDRSRTLNLSETKPCMSDPELRMLSLRLVAFITIIIHGSVEEQWIFWRHSHTHTQTHSHSHTHTHTHTHKHTHTHIHTHTACITFCCKNVNVYTNFTYTLLFLGIENCCRCAIVGLWYGKCHCLSFVFVFSLILLFLLFIFIYCFVSLFLLFLCMSTF
jgi:hypothetical protein